MTPAAKPRTAAVARDFTAELALVSGRTTKRSTTSATTVAVPIQTRAFRTGGRIGLGAHWAPPCGGAQAKPEYM